MSRKARTATIAANLGRGHFTAPPRETHVHSFTLTRTNGNRIRYGCPCGHWDPWRRMGALEIATYRPQQFAKRLAAATKKATDPMVKMMRESAKVFDGLTESLKGITVPQDDKPDVRALLAQTHNDAVQDTAHQVDNIAGEAGVTVELPDRDDDHSLAITEDFEPEEDREEGPSYQSTRDMLWVLDKHGKVTLRDTEDANACPKGFVIESGPAEFDPIEDEWFVPASVRKRLGYKPDDDRSDTDYESDKDMCYLVLGSNPPMLLPREDAHQELDEYRQKNPNGPHQIGDALWDDDMGEWKLPIEIADGTDDSAVTSFVAQSFGVDGDPDLIADDDAPDRFHLELDFGNDRHMGYANSDVDDLFKDLSKNTRDDLEFAARKIGIRGVTTKVRKDYLVRALIASGDTTLVREHALNRAAVMLRTAMVDSDTEWFTHYVGQR